MELEGSSRNDLEIKHGTGLGHIVTFILGPIWILYCATSDVGPISVQKQTKMLSKQKKMKNKPKYATQP